MGEWHVSLVLDLLTNYFLSSGISPGPVMLDTAERRK